VGQTVAAPPSAFLACACAVAESVEGAAVSIAVILLLPEWADPECFSQPSEESGLDY